MMSSFDCNYQNAFRCNLCYVDLYHARAILHKREDISPRVNCVYVPICQIKEMYHDYFTYLMDERLTAEKMSREYWDELDEALPYGASLQQEIPLWPWPTRIVVCVQKVH